MKTTSISSAKNNLSALLHEVRAGETVLITDRGVPVARLEPVSNTESDTGPALEQLIRRGLVVPAKRPSTLDVFDLPLPSLSSNVSASALLIEERESGY